MYKNNSIKETKFGEKVGRKKTSDLSRDAS